MRTISGGDYFLCERFLDHDPDLDLFSRAWPDQWDVGRPLTADEAAEWLEERGFDRPADDEPDGQGPPVSLLDDNRASVFGGEPLARSNSAWPTSTSPLRHASQRRRTTRDCIGVSQNQPGPERGVPLAQAPPPGVLTTIAPTAEQHQEGAKMTTGYHRIRGDVLPVDQIEPGRWYAKWYGVYRERDGRLRPRGVGVIGTWNDPVFNGKTPCRLPRFEMS